VSYVTNHAHVNRTLASSLVGASALVVRPMAVHVFRPGSPEQIETPGGEHVFPERPLSVA
jgi:hypothetical protein